MNALDTIAAIASPPGRSARAVVRISGRGTRPLLRDRFVHATEAVGHEVGGAGAMTARFRLAGSLELPCLLLTYRGPRSYTGEDAAEILIPGNPVLGERVLSSLLETPGVRLARPGEFTARAYLNGKLTLDRAESVGALIGARNAEELAAARRLAEGRTGDLHRRWTAEVAALLALVEAGIDFTDQEDVVAIAPESLAARLEALIAEIRAHLGAAAGDEPAREAPTVVLAGAPNAGKSTLFNALLGHRRAIESPEAGTTRDALRETLDLSRDAPGAPAVTLIDLPGLDGAPGTGIHAAAQKQARNEISRADLIIHCDPAGRFAESELPVDRDRPGRPIIRVRTKADLAHSAPASDLSLSTSDIPVCALDGWNLRALRRAIADQARGSSTAASSTVPARHRRALFAALTALTAAAGLAPGSRHNPELVADRLREAAEPLSELIGRLSIEDILGRVFSTFCVGK